MSYRKQSNQTSGNSSSSSDAWASRHPEYTSRSFNAQFYQQQQLEEAHCDAEWYKTKCSESLKESLRTVAETNELGQHTAERLCQQTGEFVFSKKLEQITLRETLSKLKFLFCFSLNQ